MRLSDLRDLLGAPHRYRIECPDSPDYMGQVVVGARWGCGCAAQGERFADLATTPCSSHSDRLGALRSKNVDGPLGVHAS